MRLLLQILLSAALTASFFSGCTPRPEPEKPKQVVDPTLPIVEINGYLSDINAIAFEWKSISDTRVKGVHIYRAAEGGETPKLSRVGSVEGRYATHFLDRNVAPDTRYLYRFTTYNAKGAESTGSETVTAVTKPVIPSVSFFASIGNMPRSAKLIWRPHTNPKVKAYRIERQDSGSTEWKSIATVEGRLNAEYIDNDLDDNAVYRYRLRAVTYDNIVSTPSELVKVTTKPLPETVGDITVTTDLPRKIVITWAPLASNDLDFYKVYRADSSAGSYNYHVKTRDTRFEDTVKADGQTYYYKITAVDRDGLEGEQQSIPAQGSTLVKPAAPVIISAGHTGNAFAIEWQNSDSRTVSYTIVKTTHESWISKTVQEITGVKQATFRDIEIAPDTRYEYQVMAVDQYGIPSEATKPVELSYKADQ